MSEGPRSTFLVDTCVWVNIRDEHGDSQEIWDACFRAIEAGTIKTVRHVYGELERRFPDVHARLKPYRGALIVADGEMYHPDVVAEIRAVHAQHPGLYDALGVGNPADPFLIGVAKHTGAIVVTDERSAGKGYKSKIPYVCTQRNVGWTARLDFFRAVGIEW